MITLEKLELLLELGHLQIAMKSGKWWTVRRNGKTQIWKTRPGHFRIPLKMGFRGHWEITHRDLVDGELSSNFRLLDGRVQS